METIKQEYYPHIEFDDTETDILQIWQHGKDESNVIQIERCNIELLIDQLILCNKQAS